MKLGWLVWMYEDNECPVLMDEAPSWCFKSVRIVYAEIVE